ncbi:hypothetical protein CN311_06870 [Mesorhizobium sanjuanii]|uniref:Tlde1 domain-containing protein n=1 Tax=Mesorhizobium sanjuanii TaxID=2037900 RepID=A0A2A6FJ52_9HYPH|nr:tlde1 domain-containing protein [Mesorhizobium sanjuanii]PDQ21854.1 hypothetical protein CN311_06870 [Mesorhizobium sanjuanii]
MRPSLRWVAVPAVGAAVVLWSVATMAGLYSVGASLTAASNSLPQSLLAPRTIAFADQRSTLANSWAHSWAPQLSTGRQASLLNRCDAGCMHAAGSFSHDGKAARIEPLARSNEAAPVRDRFDSVVAKAALSPQKLAAAFANASSHVPGAPSALASLPVGARFAGAARVPDPRGPASERFGPEVAVIERSSRLALALANALPEQTIAEQMIDVLPPAAMANDAAAAQEPQQGEMQVASLPPQDEMPDSIPVPSFRPQAKSEQSDEAPKAPSTQPAKPSKAAQAPKAKASKTVDAPQVETQSPRALSPRNSALAALPGVEGSQGVQGNPASRNTRASQGTQSGQSTQSGQGKPAKRSKAQAGDMLAFAKPDNPERGVGGAFKNLFTRPSLGSGVAVYDISAKTVYMPDGSRLEAHSGIGSMADKPQYANRKNVGPTPPGTYDLKLRESRFYGVEAIRLTPTSGDNKYGRDGLLAHSYLLRGGRAESHGCVAFKDYARFLAAYKKGKIKRLVVRG